MMTFPCTKCGACCASIDHIDFLEAYNQNGVCTHLKNSICEIYEQRPLLCRIDEAYEEIFSTYMIKNQYYLTNALACNKLQQEKNIDESYRIDVSIFQ